MIQKLHALGIKDTIMLTGDNAVVARAVCRNIGLTRHFADMLPADKADSHPADCSARAGASPWSVTASTILPRLSFADVGIAMKHGAEVTHESADIILMEDSLWRLVKAVEISQGAVRLIKQNYAIVAGLNTLALGLALPGGLDHARGHGADQQRLGHSGQHERYPANPAVPMIAELATQFFPSPIAKP